MRLRHPIPGAPWGAAYGWRGAVAGLPAGLHNGQDFPAPTGTRVYAAADGVAYRRWEGGGFGNYIYMQHGSGRETFYAHLNGFAVNNGTRVKAGQLIGYVGSTGASTGPHLHFSYRKNGTWINPRPLIYTPSSGSSTSKGKTMITPYYRRDLYAGRRSTGRTLKPGGHLYLNEKNNNNSNATNIVGGIGEYIIFPHIYATGTPGDRLIVKLIWQDTTKTPRRNSPHYDEELTIGPKGTLKANLAFARHVSRGYAVYVSVGTPKDNKGNVKITMLASDARLIK